MNRRDFLKLIGVASIAPSVLLAPRVNPITIGIDMAIGKSLSFLFLSPRSAGQCYFYEMWKKNPVGITLEDIPKDGYGWVALF